MSDIFDLKDISDIPQDLKDELNLLSDVDNKMLYLFKEKEILNINEVMVSWFRKYGEVRSRQYFMTTLYRMKRKGVLVSMKGKGVYSIREDLK